MAIEQSKIDAALAAHDVRVRAIVDSPEAKGREALAQHLALSTKMTAADAIATLAAAPRAAGFEPAKSPSPKKKSSVFICGSSFTRKELVAMFGEASIKVEEENAGEEIDDDDDDEKSDNDKPKRKNNKRGKQDGERDNESGKSKNDPDKNRKSGKKSDKDDDDESDEDDEDAEAVTDDEDEEACDPDSKSGKDKSGRQKSERRVVYGLMSQQEIKDAKAGEKAAMAYRRAGFLVRQRN